MNLGNSIKSFRKRLTMSQADLAKACGISQTYLSQIENNKREPNLSTLKLIGDKLDVPLPILFFISLDGDDIPDDKKEFYNIIHSSLSDLISSIFTDSSAINDQDA